MFRKIKLITKLLLLQLTAKSQNIPFEQIPFSNPLTTDVDSILHTQVKGFFKKAKAPGLIIGISRNGVRQVFIIMAMLILLGKKSFNAETIFEIGSITKTFTANLLFQLAEQKVIDIQKSVLNYLPPDFNTDSNLKKIKLPHIRQPNQRLSPASFQPG